MNETVAFVGLGILLVGLVFVVWRRTMKPAAPPTAIGCPFCLGEVSSEAQKCCHCSEWLKDKSSAGVVLGALIFMAGLSAFVFFLQVDPTVPSAMGGGRTYNIGLMHQQQIGVIAGGIGMIVGLLIARK